MYIRLDEQLYMVGGGDGGPGISHYKDCNVYLIVEQECACLIDAGSGLDTECILENIRETGCSLERITHLFVTHAHGDHGGGVKSVQQSLPNVRVYASAGEKRLLEHGTEEELGLIAAKKKGAYPKDYIYHHGRVDEVLEDETVYSIGRCTVTSILIPGHSIESACYLVEKNERRYLFSGDSLYLNGTLSLINCYGSTMEGYRGNIGKLANRKIDALIPSHFRFTLQGGQGHVDKAIEFVSYSSLPPMV